MGLESSCIRKPNDELIIEKNLITKEKTNEDYIKEFNSLYEMVEFNNDEIKDKWNSLPRFKFEDNEHPDSIVTVIKDISVLGETYYGFMYSYL